MAAQVRTVAFHGVEVIEVEAQVTITSGLPAFTVVGLPDKAVAELRERVRAALTSLGLALPPRHITVNLAPADVLEGRQPFRPADRARAAGRDGGAAGRRDRGYIALGELSLDGSVTSVAGVLLAGARRRERTSSGIICPAACGGEAAWAGEVEIVAAPSLLAIVNHFKGTQLLPPPEARLGAVARRRARPPGRQGPGKRQARARNRRGRRAQSVDGRAARLGQVDAGGAAARHLAAARADRGAGARHDPVGRGRVARRRAVARAAVPRPAPFGLAAGAGRRRDARAPGRDHARASGRAVSRRAARVQPRGARSVAPAARNRPGQHRPRQRPRHLPGALSADRGDEPVPLRPLRRGGLRPRPALRRRISGAALRPVARPHRSAHRRAGGVARRSRSAAAEREQCGGRQTGRGGAAAPGNALCRGSRGSSDPHQRRGRRRAPRRGRDPRSRRAARCWCGRPSACASPPAAITVCCGWR